MDKSNDVHPRGPHPAKGGWKYEESFLGKTRPQLGQALSSDFSSQSSGLSLGGSRWDYGPSTMECE